MIDPVVSHMYLSFGIKAYISSTARSPGCCLHIAENFGRNCLTMHKVAPHSRSSLYPMTGQWRRVEPSTQNVTTLSTVPTQCFPHRMHWVLCWNRIAVQLLPLPNPAPLIPLQVFFFLRALSIVLHSNLCFTVCFLGSLT